MYYLLIQVKVHFWILCYTACLKVMINGRKFCKLKYNINICNSRRHSINYTKIHLCDIFSHQILPVCILF